MRKFRLLRSLAALGCVTVVPRPAVVSPLSVATNSSGGRETLLSRELLEQIAALQKGKHGIWERAPLSAGSGLDFPHLELKERILSSRSLATMTPDWLGGDRRGVIVRVLGALEEIGATAATDSLLNILLGSRAPSTLRAYARCSSTRRAWLERAVLPDDQTGIICFLADRAREVGPQALAQAVAAFNFGYGRSQDQQLSDLTGLLVQGARRRTADTAKAPLYVISREDVNAVVQFAESNPDLRTTRGAAIVCLSYHALLRASEAAFLRADDVSIGDSLVAVKVSKAKNDQLARGRTSFFRLTADSPVRSSILRWSAARRSDSSSFFHSLTRPAPISPRALSKEAKKILLASGVHVTATHHSLRRGGASAAAAEGRSADQIQRLGRWRSSRSLDFYIKDSPESQGALPVLPRT